MEWKCRAVSSKHSSEGQAKKFLEVFPLINVFCSVLQGAHGLKGNEGPHGPPGPAVSTIYWISTHIFFCFLNTYLVNSWYWHNIDISDFYLTFICHCGDILGFSWWAWSCWPSWTYRSSWTPWTSRTSRTSWRERRTSKKIIKTIKNLRELVADGNWCVVSINKIGRERTSRPSWKRWHSGTCGSARTWRTSRTTWRRWRQGEFFHAHFEMLDTTGQVLARDPLISSNALWHSDSAHVVHQVLTRQSGLVAAFCPVLPTVKQDGGILWLWQEVRKWPFNIHRQEQTVSSRNICRRISRRDSWRIICYPLKKASVLNWPEWSLLRIRTHRIHKLFAMKIKRDFKANVCTYSDAFPSLVPSMGISEVF